MSHESIDVVILTGEARTERGISSMMLYGASARGAVRLVFNYQPYFYAETRASLPPSVATPIDLDSSPLFTSLTGVPVKKFQFRSIPEAERARRYLKNTGMKLFESDVRHRERFLMDAGINGGARVCGDGSMNGNLWCMSNPQITPMHVSVPLRVCSFDIETSTTSASQVFSVAGHCSGPELDTRRVFIRASRELHQENTVSVSDERELLASFEEWILENDPDLIIGWNVIGFDLRYLLDRAAALRVPLRLGREKRAFSIDDSRGRFSAASIPGRVVLDGPQLLRSSFFSFESYSLENVAQAVLGEGKLLASDAGKAKEIERLFAEDPSALAAYNLHDSILVTRIFEKLELLELTRRRSELSGMLLDQVGRSTASLDHFYLPRLHQRNYVAPDVAEGARGSAGTGGYVMSPQAGIYDNIVSLDFQSLYPTIIRTFQIDPLSRVCLGEDPIVTPSGHKFGRSCALLPPFIGELMRERARAKELKNAPLSQAVKILMNSFYGVMGSTGSRLYDPALPDAITLTGQWLLKESMRWIEEQGHRVLYGDTDSLFVQLITEQHRGFERAGRDLAAQLTSWWKERLLKEFGVESYLVLEFDTHYSKFLLPRARAAEGGAKKRYAGLVHEDTGDRVDFVGLEVVRSDWTRLAREFQQELYGKIFRGESIEEWVRSYVQQLQSGKFDDKLVYRKRLHKSVDEYGDSPPPYVKAARLLHAPRREIRYVITVEGPVPAEHPHKMLDYEHYITKQLRPVADSILEALGRSFDEIISPQLRLL